MARTWNQRISARAIVRTRAGGRCEICAVELTRGDQKASSHGSMHHRFQRANGGRDTPSNLLHLCAVCHSKRIHDNPELALQMGWLVLNPDEVVTCAVMTSQGWTVIAEDGSMSSLPWWRVPDNPSRYDDIDCVQTA